METQTFDGLGIKPEILEVLNKLKFSVPTPIQSQAIPVAIGGNDVIGIAQTGTGKTLAFGIPAIQSLMTSGGSALIILPTRELALQVDESLNKIFRSFNLRSAVLIGGQNMAKQMRDLKAGPRIIVSTPGRLIDHLERRTVSLSKVSILVLDEADRMLDMGFAPQIKRILQEVPKERQTMLFSATMPAEIVSIANQYMKTPLRVEVAPAGSATNNVTHEIFFVKDGSKLALLETILKAHTGSILVFSRTKFGAKKIAFAIRKLGYSSTEIHSNRTLPQRMAALAGFKQGKFQVMVATDIAARGIDVKGIELVINYDLPDCPEDYVHRIGRTGRAENLGHAISFATPKQAYDVRIIERLIKKPLPVSKLPEMMQIDPAIMEGGPERGGGRDSRDRQSRPSESRGRSASGSRYSRSAKPSGVRPGREESRSDYAPANERRGFLPKKPHTEADPRRSGSDRNPAYASKGKDFYKDSFFNSSDYNRSDRTQEESDGTMDFGDKRFEGSGRKPFGVYGNKPQGASRGRSGGNQRSTYSKDRPASSSRPDSKNIPAGATEERKPRNFVYKDKPATEGGEKTQRKPFVPGKKFAGSRPNKNSSFGKGPKKAFARTSR